jgi:hypothetical protein
MASIIKADNIQKVSDGTNIIKKCGSTTTLGSCGVHYFITLGRCGGTVTLACGATQSGFGQTYSAVAYCTTAKTSPFTAAAGTGYFINTTCGAVTVTLPASPTAGDVVSFKDYASQWNTNSVTLCNNGNKINGVCETAKLSTEGQSVTLIYVDGTKGWQDIQDSTSNITGGGFITATGGTISCCGDYKIHTFTSDGTFCVSAGAGPLAVVDYLVIAGGAGGTHSSPGSNGGGGGGAGGYRESYNPCTSGCYSASPLATPTSLPVSITSYPIIVGAGGAGGSTSVAQTNGSNSIFSTITSAGGGRAGGNAPGRPLLTANTGGSGGGGGGGTATPGSFGCGAAGNTPPVSPPQGNAGSPNRRIALGPPSPDDNPAGGGGGATAAGAYGASAPVGGNGGAGATTSISASPTAYAGGGAGGGNPPGSGGTGGGGGGGTAGTTNTGGGGGSTMNGSNGGAGGSGIVIIRYKFQ